MKISSSMFSVIAKQSLKLAKSTGLDSKVTSDEIGLNDAADAEEAKLLPETTPDTSGTKGGKVSDVTGDGDVNPNDPETNAPTPEMTITGGYPSWMNKPLIGLAGLLDICSPANLEDVRAKNTSKGKVKDPYCCDCGEGGVPVIGGGYILLKTLDKLKELQQGSLKRYINQYKSGKLSKGQALVGITGVLNKSLHSQNGDLIPTAAELPIGQEGVKVTLKDAVERSDMDWIKAADTGLGQGVVAPILGDNMGTLTGGLLTRGDFNGVKTLDGIAPGWSSQITMGSMKGDPKDYKTDGLNDEQAKDVAVASAVKDKRAVAA